MLSDYQIILIVFGLLSNGLLGGIFLRLGSLSKATENNTKSISSLWAAVNEMRGSKPHMGDVTCH
jgi:hypothetical protein